MTPNKKEQISQLLKGIETGDPASVLSSMKQNTYNTIRKHMKEVKDWQSYLSGYL